MYWWYYAPICTQAEIEQIVYVGALLCFSKWTYCHGMAKIRRDTSVNKVKEKNHHYKCITEREHASQSSHWNYRQRSSPTPSDLLRVNTGHLSVVRQCWRRRCDIWAMRWRVFRQQCWHQWWRWRAARDRASPLRDRPEGRLAPNIPINRKRLSYLFNIIDWYTKDMFFRGAVGRISALSPPVYMLHPRQEAVLTNSNTTCSFIYFF